MQIKADKTFVIDIESNGLLEQMVDHREFPYKAHESARLWCIVLLNVATAEEFVWDINSPETPRDFLEGHLSGCSALVGHNILKFDLPALRLLGALDYEVAYPDSTYDTIFGNECRIVDTLIMSRLFNPDRPYGHSLEEWGNRLNFHKTDWRAEAVSLGLISNGDPRGAEFLKFHDRMVEYCRQDTRVTRATLVALKQEVPDMAPWVSALRHEHKLADLAVNRETLGFWFDKDLALENVAFLEKEMAALSERVNPLLPEKELNKGELDDVTPPKNQLTKAFQPTASVKRFAARFDLELVERDGDWYMGEYKLPHHEPLRTTAPATIDDLDHVKMFLISLGWEPTEWRERDLTKNAKKQDLPYDKRVQALDRWYSETMAGKYRDQRIQYLLENSRGIKSDKIKESLKRKLNDNWPVRVPTSPSVRVGVEKELCPNLIALGDTVAFAADFAKYLTYKHRKSSILGGKLDEDGEPVTGYLSMYREEDGRVPTPAIEIGASCLTEDTLLVTSNGLKKITEVDKFDNVLTHTGKYEKVLDLIDNGIKDVWEVKLVNGSSVRCTANHPFLTTRGWVRCQELEDSDQVLSYIGEEIWKIHPVFSKYEFSSWGRVRTTRGYYLSPRTDDTIPGRPTYVDLYNGSGEKSRKTVGRAVLETFVGPGGKLEARHLDGNSTNNMLSNLKFGTSSENKLDMRLHGVIGRRRRSGSGTKLTQEQVEEIREFYSVARPRGTDSKVAKKYGVCRETISQIRRGVRWAKENDNYLDYTFKPNYAPTSIKHIHYKGRESTYDITVDNAHSYVSNGIVTHNTTRYRHIGVANIPRASSVFGKEMRSMFGCGPGAFQLGFDFASLEARIEGHYVYPYEQGPELAEQLLAEKPNDIHSVLGRKMDISRDNAKSLGYGLLYGAQPQKVSKMLSTDLNRAKQIWEDYWNQVPALKSLRDDTARQWAEDGKTFIRGIDGRKIVTRSQHSLLNALFQSGGVIAAKYVTVYLSQELEKAGLIISPFKGCPDACTMIAYHDEENLYINPKLVDLVSFDSEEEAKEFVNNWSGAQLSDIGHSKRWYVALPNVVSTAILNAVKKADEVLKLNVPLGIAWQIGKNWYQTH